MLVDLQVAFGPRHQVEQPVGRQLGQHVIQKPQAGIHLIVPCPVQGQADLHAGLARAACDLGLARLGPGFRLWGLGPGYRDLDIQDLLQRGQEGIVLFGAADRDAHPVGQPWIGKAADQDAPLGQRAGQFPSRASLQPAEAKVGLAGQRLDARQGRQCSEQSLPFGHNAGDGGLHSGHVLQGCQCSHHRRCIDVVGGAQPLHRLGHLRHRHGIPQPQTGHARPLAKGA